MKTALRICLGIVFLVVITIMILSSSDLGEIRSGWQSLGDALQSTSQAVFMTTEPTVSPY